MVDPVSLTIIAAVTVARAAAAEAAEKKSRSSKGGARVEFDKVTEIEFPGRDTSKHQIIRG